MRIIAILAQETRFLVPILILECSNLLKAVRASSVLQKLPMVMTESPRHSAKHLTAGVSWWWSCSRRRACSPQTPRRPSSRPSTPRCSRARCASSWRSGRSGRRWWPPARPAPRPRLHPPPRPRLWILSQPEPWGGFEGIQSHVTVLETQICLILRGTKKVFKNRKNTVKKEVSVIQR